MKRAVSVIIVLIVSYIFLGLTLIHASWAQDVLSRGKWWKHTEVLDKIDISDDQIKKIDEIADQSMRKIIKLEADFRIAKMDLEKLIDQVDQEKLDIEILEEQIDEVNSLRGELQKERILMLARIRNVLPKETITKLKRIRGSIRRGKREKRFGKGLEEWRDEMDNPREQGL